MWGLTFGGGLGIIYLIVYLGYLGNGDGVIYMYVSKMKISRSASNLPPDG